MYTMTIEEVTELIDDKLISFEEVPQVKLGKHTVKPVAYLGDKEWLIEYKKRSYKFVPYKGLELLDSDVVEALKAIKPYEVTK